MTAIARELDEKLRTLAPEAATSLEKLVRDALDLVEAQNGFPQSRPLEAEFFASIRTEFGSEPFERPSQGDPEGRERW